MLAPWKESYDQPRQHSRDITLPTKVCLLKAMFFFPVVMYECESWTIKKKLSTAELMVVYCGVGEDS